ncbi:MAG: NYN domain-containing protein [Pseudolysinimonas sp.]|uniref:NYN domain-containing protein n=1 Tax=Pseudolysinimonas sp. TaxID=2680009 RepID=UPI003C747C2E
MAETGESTESRVAVYIDFDNVVISRYDQLHGRDSWRKDEARRNDGKSVPKLEQARVDFGAILDYASSFGTVALSRAYADWSVPANAAYKRQLVDRAIDLTQLFPASSTKNGADIRLAVDVIDDMFRLPDITHVVIVAGDSDYIPLAQRCKRLGRVVIGIGVTGSTSPALVAALDEFESYDELQRDDAAVAAKTPAPETAASGDDTSLPVALTPATASRLLVRALDLARGKQDDDDWLNASTVKSQIKRLNPSFNEKSLGFRSFMDFVRANDEQVEIREAGQQRFMRLREQAAEAPADAAPARKPSRRAGTTATSTKSAADAPAAPPDPPNDAQPTQRAPRRAKAAASSSPPSASDPFREP